MGGSAFGTEATSQPHPISTPDDEFSSTPSELGRRFICALEGETMTLQGAAGALVRCECGIEKKKNTKNETGESCV